MVKASSGFRRGGRRRLKKPAGEKAPIERLIKEFKLQDKVIIKPEPSSQKGMPPLRYVGCAGSVVALRGRSVVVRIRSGNSNKDFTLRPEHLEAENERDK